MNVLLMKKVIMMDSMQFIDLEDDDLKLIIDANKCRWEIEESFEIMKSEFKTRPMYVTREESVKGHLLTCFISLFVYRLLKKFL